VVVNDVGGGYSTEYFEGTDSARSPDRGVLSGVVGALVGVLLIGMAVTGLVIASQPVPLANTDPTLYGQLLVADKMLADAGDAATSRIGCETRGTAPDGSVCTVSAVPDDAKPWTKVLLPVTDASVMTVQEAIAEVVSLRGWVALYTNPATKLTVKTPTADSPDFTAAAPTAGVAYLITRQQGEDLLAAVKPGQMDLADALAGLDKALGAAQKATAMDAYNTAITALEAALGDAHTLWSSTLGKVLDGATCLALLDDITEAQMILDFESGITVADSKTVADVQTVIDEMAAAIVSLGQSSQAVKDSNQAWQAQQAASQAKPKTQASTPSSGSGGGSSQPSTPGGGGGSAPTQPSAPQRPTITVQSRYDSGSYISIAYQVYDPDRVGWTVTATCGSGSESDSGVGNVGGVHSMGKQIPGCSVDTINVSIS